MKCHNYIDSQDEQFKNIMKKQEVLKFLLIKRKITHSNKIEFKIKLTLIIKEISNKRIPN